MRLNMKAESLPPVRRLWGTAAKSQSRAVSDAIGTHFGRSSAAVRSPIGGTPSLRNVALRKTFFHNGLVHSLREAVAFYVERDTQPEKWYPRGADGRTRKFDDLPAQYATNVNMDPPFGGKPGEKPALSASEIDDIVAFLGTLTDGYRPAQ
jgi:cytochrome c peroxidase